MLIEMSILASSKTVLLYIYLSVFWSFKSAAPKGHLRKNFPPV